MAVIDELPGVAVKVTVEEKALQEHIDSNVEEDSRTVTRYIESQSDQKFAICISVAKGFQFRGDCLLFRIWVDGEHAASPLIRKDQCIHANFMEHSEGVEQPQNMIQKFRFSNLKMSELLLALCTLLLADLDSNSDRHSKAP